IVLWLCNVPPLIVMWTLLARLIDRYGRSDFSRLLAMTAATFGTFLTTFGVTLNNHVHAAVCVTITVYSLTRCLSSAPEQGSRGVGMPSVPPAPPLLRSAAHFVLAGLFAALTFANELPA